MASRAVNGRRPAWRSRRRHAGRRRDRPGQHHGWDSTWVLIQFIGVEPRAVLRVAEAQRGVVLKVVDRPVPGELGLAELVALAEPVPEELARRDRPGRHGRAIDAVDACGVVCAVRSRGTLTAEGEAWQGETERQSAHAGESHIGVRAPTAGWRLEEARERGWLSESIKGDHLRNHPGSGSGRSLVSPRSPGRASVLAHARMALPSLADGPDGFATVVVVGTCTVVVVPRVAAGGLEHHDAVLARPRTVIGLAAEPILEGHRYA